MLLSRKFQIPASARNAINGVMPVTKKARGDSTSDTTRSSMSAVEFSALEQEVLRATKVAAANAKTSRNPTVPLELAQYGPFSPRPGHK